MDVVTKLTIFFVTVPLTRKYWSWSKATRMSNTVSPPSPPSSSRGHWKEITFVKYCIPPSSLSSSRGHCKDLDIILSNKYCISPSFSLLRGHWRYISFARYCTPFPFRHREPGATEITFLWPNNTTFAHNSGRVVTFSKTEKRIILNQRWVVTFCKTEKPDEETWGAHCWSFTPAKSFFENRKE